MNSHTALPNPALVETPDLRGSRATLAIAGRRATFTTWVERGRDLWADAPAARLHALRGVTNGDALALFLAAWIDDRRLLLAPPGQQLPPGCDAVADADSAAGLHWSTPARFGEGSAIKCPQGDLGVFSSGTLGPPKTLWHTRPPMLATARLALHRLQLQPGEHTLITVPLHHMYGLGAGLLPGLLADAELLLLPNANLLSVSDALRGFSPSTTFTTPYLLRSALERRDVPVAGSRQVICAGDALAQTVRERAKWCFKTIVDLYGSSELGVIATDEQTDGWMRVLPGVRATPAESDSEAAGLLIAHPHAAVRIEREGESHAPPTHWDTGDIARFASDGRFLVVGRADLSVNRAGKLLVLAEVERIATTWPGVNAAVAVPMDRHTAIGRSYALLVEAAPETSAAAGINVDSLKREAIRALPPYARPDRYHLLRRLPRLASGKPDRNAILKEYRHG